MFQDTSFLKNEEIMLCLERTADGDPDRNWLPAYYFGICLPDGTRVGQCDLRVGHNRNTYYGGNIGYGVDEAFRGRHYAANACRLLFELARRHQMDHLIITCTPENVASRKTCEALQGMLETIAELPADNDMFERGLRRVCIFRFEL